METLSPIAILIISILVMFTVISVRKSGKYLLWVVLILLFGPVTYAIMRGKTSQFLSGNHHWWEYVVGFFIVLVLLRILLNFVLPWKRR